ncbi:AN1-type zinc finger protein 1-like isoform X2 [Dysidea avara]|uniref:AN1-type zinc finger protein 1-like isoform X2 n=1 Tax=Dysidea avara TaxID=196820 RepID=UPI003326CC2D
MEFGKHCALGSCQQLDFLPFVCEACSQVFCKEHCKPEQHQCDCLESTSQQPSIGQTSGESKPLFPCELSGCDRSELVAINCVCCHKNFCIIHRHPDDHDCQEKSVSSSNVKKISLAATNSPRESKGVGRRSEKCSQMVTMMRLKQKAQGPSSIAQSYRVFYNVTLPNGDVKPLFFSKYSKVSKVENQYIRTNTSLLPVGLAMKIDEIVQCLAGLECW